MTDDYKRPDPEPDGIPEIHAAPGMADELMRELEPLLAAEGIHLGTGQTVDMETLQHAMASAIERRNMELFNPTGKARDLAVELLQEVVNSISGEDWDSAVDLLESALPESPDNSVATVAGCIGVSLGLLDSWLTGRADGAPPTLANDTKLPTDSSEVSKAAVDAIALARKGRASRSVNQMILRHGGGMNVLFGSALALAVATEGWARRTKTPTADLIPVVIR